MKDPSLSEGDIVRICPEPRCEGPEQDPRCFGTRPFQRGVVYSIDPAVQGGPVRKVHRTELWSVPAGGLRTEMLATIKILDGVLDRKMIRASKRVNSTKVKRWEVPKP